MRAKAITALSALTAILAAALPVESATAKEYILTSVKPNTLVLADPAARKVVRTYKIPGHGSPLGIVTSPDNKVAYVVTDSSGSVAGIDLDTGQQVFHATFSEDDLRVRNVFAFEISPDGKELFVLQSPMKKAANEYQVQDVRIAVYRTDGGLAAKPVRLLPAPRRTTTMLMAPDGGRLYLMSWDIHAIDPKDGKVLEVKKVFNWERPNLSPPDVFGVWSQYEQAKVFVNPYTTVRTDMDPKDPSSAKTGMLTLDLVNGEMKTAEVEDATTIMFSSVINPVRRNESFSVYNTLSKIDVVEHKVVKRIPLPHTYYSINISKDGREVYIGGTMDDIGIYSTDTLEKVGEIRIPERGDMGTTWTRVIER